MEIAIKIANIFALACFAIGLLSGAANLSVFLGEPPQKGSIPKLLVPLVWFIPVLFPRFDNPQIQKTAKTRAFLFIILVPIGTIMLLVLGGFAS